MKVLYNISGHRKIVRIREFYITSFEIKKNGESMSSRYVLLYEKMRDAIINEIYPYGCKLPSKRLTAEKEGVSIITVEHAYGLLADEGYIEARERSGFFVIFRRCDGFAVTEPRKPTHPAYHGDSSAPDFPFSVLARTMRKVMNDYGEAILDKAPGFGCPELREAIRRYLERNRGIHAELEQIVIGSGAEYLYGLIVEIIGRDAVYGIEEPSYEKIEKVYIAAGVSCKHLPLGADGIESRALESTCAKVLHISPYRSFPTGITASASKRHEYIRWAECFDRFIVEDDFESEFSLSRKPENTLFSMTDRDNVIYMNTFSRTISPALRVGYMVLPKSLLGRAEESVGFYSCTVPTFEQYVLAELISSGDFERHINRVRRRKRKDTAKS